MALILEAVALRHQIAVLERSGTRRPCFRRWDRLFWILLSRWWPRWREALMIIQPETVLRWRRNGWSGFWRYRSRGHWRGGRPRISRELRGLIARMARENFFWGAPRIHGELLMLGFKVSQATVSRYMPRSDRRPGQSWRTFLRLQAAAFSRRENLESPSDSERPELENWPAGGSEIAVLGTLHSRHPRPLKTQSPAQVKIPTRSYPARASPRPTLRVPHCRADQVLTRDNFCGRAPVTR